MFNLNRKSLMVSFDTEGDSFNEEESKHAKNKKEYKSPMFKVIGNLRTLIMGMSGQGVDSVARREF